MASSAAGGKEEEEAHEENVDLLLLSVCEDQVPMKHIDVAVATNYNWQRAIKLGIEHVVNTFNYT